MYIYKVSIAFIVGTLTFTLSQKVFLDVGFNPPFMEFVPSISTLSLIRFGGVFFGIVVGSGCFTTLVFCFVPVETRCRPALVFFLTNIAEHFGCRRGRFAVALGEHVDPQFFVLQI